MKLDRARPDDQGLSRQRAVRDPAVVESLAKLGFEPVSSTSEEFARQLAQERDRWAPVVAASGFSSEE